MRLLGRPVKWRAISGYLTSELRTACLISMSPAPSSLTSHQSPKSWGMYACIFHTTLLCSANLAIDELLCRFLRRGSLERVTASTDMNQTSSRSHAIFTIYLTHTRTTPLIPAPQSSDTASNPTPGDVPMDVVTTTAKFNFVDLAVRRAL